MLRRSRGYIGPASRARRLAAAAPRTGLPRSILTENDATSKQRGSARYTTRLEAPSDVDGCSQIGDGYNRHFGDDDDVSSLSPSHLRPGRFGGIPANYRSDFGHGPNSLLTGDADGHAGSRGVASNDGYTRNLSPHDNRSHDNDDGYTRNLSRHSDDDDDLSVTAFQLRPGRFGGQSQMYRHGFGGGPSTLLSGGRGFLTNSVTGDESQKNRRGHGVGDGDAAASQQGSGGGSVLAALRNWRKRRDNVHAPGDEVEQRSAEPGQHPGESSVKNNESGSG